MLLNKSTYKNSTTEYILMLLSKCSIHSDNLIHKLELPICTVYYKINKSSNIFFYFGLFILVANQYSNVIQASPIRFKYPRPT